jgi:hypothetical protein
MIVVVVEKKEKRKKNDADVSKNAQGFEDDDYD